MKIIKRISNEPLDYLLALMLVYGNGSWLQILYNTYFKITLIAILGFYFLLKAKSRQLSYANPIALIVPLFLIGSTLLNFSYKSNVNSILSTFLIIFILSLLNIKSLITLLNKYKIRILKKTHLFHIGILLLLWIFGGYILNKYITTDKKK